MARKVLVALGIAVLVGAVFGPVRRFGFVYDDAQYLLENPLVLAGLSAAGVKGALQSFYAENWHPLTWISHMADVSLFGLRPEGHHLTSLGLHALNAVALFLVLSRLTGALWRSAAAAALFAVHPLRLESVAWVAERKDVLCALFWFLALGAYLWYVRAPRAGRYAAVCVLFGLGLAAKPMLVTFPFLLLLLDYWPLRRPWSALLVAEKLPLAALSALSSYLTFQAQAHGGAVVELQRHPVGARLANAVAAYAAYLGKMFWPAGLTVFYPYPAAPRPLWHLAAAAGLLLGITALALRASRRRGYPAVGWLWYLGTLVPVIGLVQVGSQAMADRYTYVPGIGILLLGVWGAADLAARRPAIRGALPVACAAVVLALAVSARAQLSHWRDEEALFRRALEVTRGNWLAHGNLATSLLRAGRLPEAREHFTEALRLQPGYVQGRVGLGMVLEAEGRFGEAEALYREAVRLRPGYAVAHQNLGALLARSGLYGPALAEFQEALRAAPGNPVILENLGALHAEAGRPQEAMRYFAESLRIRPNGPGAHFGLGNLAWRRADAAAAEAHFREAVRLDPRHVEALNNLAALLLDAGRAGEAAGLYRRALALRPEDPRIRRNLEEALRAAPGAR